MQGRGRAHHDFLLAPRAWALALLLAIPAAAQPAAERPPELSLDEAVARAIENAPTVVQAQGQVTSADAGRRSAVGAYLPTLSGNAGGNVSSTERFDPNTNITASGSATSLSAGLSTSWDLFTGFRRRANLNRAEALQTGARADLVAEERTVTFDVTVAFHEALRAGQLVQVANARIERARVGLDAAERRSSVGAATRSDVLRANLELNEARTAELEAQNNRRAAELELGRLVGAKTPIRPRASGAESPPPAIAEREQLVDEVLSTFPELASARAQVLASDAAVSAAKGAYWPSLRLSAGYDWFGQAATYFPGRDSWSVRLGLSVPIFDGFVRDEATTRARVQVATSQSQLAELERIVRVQVERAIDQLLLATERLALTGEAVEVAREDLRVQQERYGLGVSTMLELLTSQENLVTAENDQVAARLDQDVARAQLTALTGRKL